MTPTSSSTRLAKYSRLYISLSFALYCPEGLLNVALVHTMFKWRGMEYYQSIFPIRIWMFSLFCYGIRCTQSHTQTNKHKDKHTLNHKYLSTTKIIKTINCTILTVPLQFASSQSLLSTDSFGKKKTPSED